MKAKGKKLTKAQEKALAKKKAKAGKKRDAGDSDSDFDMDFAYKKAKPLPGQLENCDICNKRFTVTPYSKTGPDGGLLCLQCGKELAKDEGGKLEKKAKSAAQGRKRRKVESDRLDHRVNLGAKTLQQMCIEKVAVHYEDLEEFGDLPQGVMVRLSEIFTKRRVLDPKTLKLFLRSDLDEIVIHDCASMFSLSLHHIDFETRC